MEKAKTKILFPFFQFIQSYYLGIIFYLFGFEEDFYGFGTIVRGISTDLEAKDDEQASRQSDRKS